MSLTQDQITALNFKKFLNAITPYIGGSGGTTYTAGNGIVIDEDEISTDNMESTDLAEIVTNMPSVQTNLPRYSTEEQKVGYWIDGKPIYQKSFYLTSSINWDGANDIGLINVSKIINSFIYALRENDNYTFPLSVVNPSGLQYSAGYLFSNSFELELRKGSSIGSLSEVYGTVQYTKTTDTPI